MRYAGTVLAILFLWSAGFSASPGDFSRVKRLSLSYKGFILGERVRTAGLKPVEGALSGTLRYRKGELILAVDERTHRLIALYEEYKDLGPQQLREVVGRLMALFGEPTFEAHDRMLFWYFTEKGKVSRETFEGWREAGVKPSLLAVAKFVCGRPIVEFAKKEKGKGHTQAYFTLYSPLLIHRVLKERTLKESL